MNIQITEVLRRSEQGVTLPFICRGEDNATYFVKGRGAGRRSLISEYLCGKLAVEFGLPIADFAIVDVPELLIKGALTPDIQDLGAGLAFGSKALSHVQELHFPQLKTISERIKRDVVMFDWWVLNSDRTLNENGGNPNLLWDQKENKLVVIDHNTAFETNFDRKSFCEKHIFCSVLPSIFGDMVEREHYKQRFAQTFDAFDSACDNVPEEWWWVDDGVPAQFDRVFVRNSLLSFDQDFFWSMP